MKQLTKTILLLLILIGFISCHKYPEDPFISFKRPAKRIEGTWNITSYQIYGVEHSHDFDSFLSPNTLADYGVNFTPFSYGSHQNTNPNGSWEFRDKNNNPLFNRISLGLGKTTFEFTDVTTLGFYYSTTNGTTVPPSDSTFFNLFFYQNKTLPNLYAPDYEFTIVELYGKHLHISRDGVDIYFKKQ